MTVSEYPRSTSDQEMSVEGRNLVHINFLLVKKVLDCVLDKPYKIGDVIDFPKSDRKEVIHQIKSELTPPLIEYLLTELLLDLLDTTVEGLNHDLDKIWTIKRNRPDISTEELSTLLLLSEAHGKEDEEIILSILDDDKTEQVLDIAKNMPETPVVTAKQTRILDPNFI